MRVLPATGFYCCYCVAQTARRLTLPYSRLYVPKKFTWWVLGDGYLCDRKHTGRTLSLAIKYVKDPEDHRTSEMRCQMLLKTKPLAQDP